MRNENDVLRELQNGTIPVEVNALLWQNYFAGIIHYHCDIYHILTKLTTEITHYTVWNSWDVINKIDTRFLMFLWWEQVYLVSILQQKKLFKISQDEIKSFRDLIQ